jgi:RHS repeat-associated protein
MGVRHYDATVGRFLQEDPIGLQGGDINLMRYAESVGKVSINLYEYALNSPLRYIDPWGLDAGYPGGGVGPNGPAGYTPRNTCPPERNCWKEFAAKYGVAKAASIIAELVIGGETGIPEVAESAYLANDIWELMKCIQETGQRLPTSPQLPPGVRL